MDTTLDVVPRDSPVAAVIRATAQRAQDYVSQAKASSTVRAYRHDWNCFETWCRQRGLSSLPAAPETAALYLVDLAPVRRSQPSERRLAAIAKAHQTAGHDSPASLRHAAVSEVWNGIRRVHGTAQVQKAPVAVEDLRRMFLHLPTNELLAARDRALLLIGFADAFRRSELVALNVEDVQLCADGLLILLPRSKTDQEGEGRKIAVPYGSTPDTCPVRSCQCWLESAEIATGPLFRRHGNVQTDRLSDKAVALVIKRYAEAAGLDPKKYAGHSLRSGLVTAAAIAGVSERSIMQQTGHKSSTMVRRYIRDANLFRDNAAARIGL
jgi:site-specific recombinase XerD